MFLCLLLAATVAAKQDLYSTYTSKDLDGASDHVTSILVQPGPEGPRHVILTEQQQQEFFPHEQVDGRSLENSYHFSSADYPLPPRSEGYRAPPSPTYGPARPVEMRSRRGQLHHRGKAPAHAKGLSEAIYKYTTFVKHDAKHGAKHAEHEAPEGLTTDGDERVHENGFDRREKPRKALPFSKLFAKHSYIPLDKRRPAEFDARDERVDGINSLKSHEERFNAFEDEDDLPEKRPVFDDSHGGRVAPLLARFYKQPLPVIETRLPSDNTGLFLQYFPRMDFDDRTERSVRYQPSESEWTPINAPSGAVPAKSYSIRAPDLAPKRQPQLEASQRPYQTVNPYSRQGTPEPAVVVGKSKRPISGTTGGHIQANSEGVVSAVVRVKQ